MGAGKFIVLEGIDGAGTTTQSERLAAWMREQLLPVYLTREPSSGEVGQMIRHWLAGCAPEEETSLRDHGLALLFAADRLDHLAREIVPQLNQGVHVVSDRYLLSSLAYQSLDCDPAWVAAINREAVPPDLTLLLDLPVETAMQRVTQRGGRPEIFERADLQERIRGRYLEVVRELSDEGAVVVLDGSPDPDQVFAAVRRTVEPLLEGGGEAGRPGR